MLAYEDIRSVHLELSTNCNASCPLCPRNFGGMDYNFGYPITSLSIDQIEQIFDSPFVSQLKHIIINGNLGDFMLAKDALEIVDYFRKNNQSLMIEISTNGGARDSSFWHNLAQYRPHVQFCLDGLEDTHSLYRRFTDFNNVIKNAKTFISAGGRAIWKMVLFDHNKHQVDECRRLAKDLGFVQFDLINAGRDTAIVYDRKGEFLYNIGQPVEFKEADRAIKDFRESNVLSNFQDDVRPITCMAKQQRQIYVSANGEVSPCCFLGFYPRTYDEALVTCNGQVKELLADVKNNALEKPLRECIEWFNLVEQSWAKQSFDEGRLWRCNEYCGQR